MFHNFLFLGEYIRVPEDKELYFQYEIHMFFYLSVWKHLK